MLSEKIERLLEDVERPGYREACDIVEEHSQLLHLLRLAQEQIEAYEFLATHASSIKVEYSFGGNDNLYNDNLDMEEFNTQISYAMGIEYGSGDDEEAEEEESQEQNAYWVSWYHDLDAFGEFELHNPWWFTGCDMNGRDTTCAAVLATSEEDAERQIYACYDKAPAQIEFRFTEERDADWSPFNSRFPQAAWMKWR